MRVLPWFMGAVVVVAAGGAVAGAAISTTPRQIHDSPAVSGASIGIGGQQARSETLSANHYPLETQGETYEVAELRERGLYSQDRYAQRYYVSELDQQATQFDYAAADIEQRQWEAQQRPALRERPVATRQPAARPAATQPLDLQRPAKVTGSKVTFVSQPVVQDTSGMTRR